MRPGGKKNPSRTVSGRFRVHPIDTDLLRSLVGREGAQGLLPLRQGGNPGGPATDGGRTSSTSDRSDRPRKISSRADRGSQGARGSRCGGIRRGGTPRSPGTPSRPVGLAAFVGTFRARLAIQAQKNPPGDPKGLKKRKLRGTAISLGFYSIGPLLTSSRPYSYGNSV